MIVDEVTRAGLRERLTPCPQCGELLRGCNTNQHMRIHGIEPDILRMREANWSIDAIASLLQVSRDIVRHVLRRHNVTTRRVTPITRLSHDEIARTLYLYHQKKLSLSEVGRALRLAKSTVHYRLVQAGASPRSRQESAPIEGQRRRRNNQRQ